MKKQLMTKTTSSGVLFKKKKQLDLVYSVFKQRKA